MNIRRRIAAALAILATTATVSLATAGTASAASVSTNFDYSNSGFRGSAGVTLAGYTWSTQAVIQDTCPSCAPDLDLDISFG